MTYSVCALVLAALFITSGTDKLVHSIRRAASWHPVVLDSPMLRRHANPLFAAAGIADLVAAGLLFFSGPYGAMLIALLVVLYTAVASASGVLRTGERSCRCLAGFFDAPSRTFFWVRNVALVLVALTAAVEAQAGATRQLGIGAAAISILMLAALAAAAAVIRSTPHRRRLAAAELTR